MPSKEVNLPVNTNRLVSQPRGSSPGSRSNPSRRSDQTEPAMTTRPEPVLDRVGPSTDDRRR
jgi:hypothetical protein